MPADFSRAVRPSGWQPWVVIVSFTRLSPDGLHAVRIERGDGVVLSNARSRNRAGYIPHDMGHLVADQAFGLHDGFWGSVAEGALFGSLDVVEGKLRHDARVKSAAILKRNRLGLGLSEVLAGPPYDAVEHGWDLDTTCKAVARAWGYVRAGEPPYDRAVVASAIDAFRQTRKAWEATPVGDSLCFEWQTQRRARVSGPRRRR